MKLRFLTNGNKGLSLGKEIKKRKAFYEGGHLLEKLEFALAVAQTKGEQSKSTNLKKRIAELGGNIEEPGT